MITKISNYMASYGLEKRRLDTPIALPRRVLPPVALRVWLLTDKTLSGYQHSSRS